MRAPPTLPATSLSLTKACPCRQAGQLGVATPSTIVDIDPALRRPWSLCDPSADPS